MTTKKKYRRSDYKLVTIEAKVLKYFRQTRKISVRKAAKIIGVSEACLNHAENGRRDINLELILKVIKVYGYCYEQFKEYCEGENLIPEDDLEVCIRLLKKMETGKLKTLRNIIESFN